MNIDTVLGSKSSNEHPVQNRIRSRFVNLKEVPNRFKPWWLTDIKKYKIVKSKFGKTSKKVKEVSCKLKGHQIREAF